MGTWLALSILWYTLARRVCSVLHEAKHPADNGSQLGKAEAVDKALSRVSCLTSWVAHATSSNAGSPQVQRH